MRKIENQIELSASDLSNHIACKHVTFLDLEVAEGRMDKPKYQDPMLDILQERGLDFETEYLQFLKSKNFTISEPATDEASGLTRTLSAMNHRVDFIYQASLRNSLWQGKADFLKRVDKPSSLGAWSYEVIDTKLSKETRAGTILQICLYSELVAEIQGIMPEFMHVLTPEEGFTCNSYRLDDFLAYHRLVKARLENAINNKIDVGETYPNPVAHCEICRWWQHCDRQRRNDDHLSLVAGLSSSQTVEIKKWGINTLELLGVAPLPFQKRPSRGAIDTYEKLREQARVQLEARKSNSPVFELLKLEESKGFYKLPEPSEGDIFFDFESDPFVGTSGLEYLFGWVLANEEGEYYKLWALNPGDEKKSFEEFVDMVMKRWAIYPTMHIYHYTAYEPSALKRLMGKYATKEIEIDKMLRAGIFIDLHGVTKQVLRAGIEHYSLKELEIFHGFERELELRQAALHLRNIERILERNTADIPQEIIDGIEIYNKEDCLSTLRLRSWLEILRADVVGNGIEIARPEIGTGEASEALTEYQQSIAKLYESLCGQISFDKLERNELQQGTWLIANMLEWYRREKKATWWEYFRLRDLPDSELLEEKAAIAYLNFTGKRVLDKKSVIDEYSFQPQECDVRAGDKLKSNTGDTLGEVISIDLSNCTIDIRKGPKNAEVHATSVFKHTDVPDKVKEDAILRIAQWINDNGIDADGPFRAGRDLLLGYSPRVFSEPNQECNSQDLAIDWVQLLNNSVLPIQGPPGAGKSHTAAQMILALVRLGKKVGITATGHKVIKGLLEKVVKASTEQGMSIKCIQKVSVASTDISPGIIETTDNDGILSALKSGQAQIAAGTAWLWAREDLADSVDVLFVDEAGQLSLIDAIAVSQAAKSLVLLGDPQQLKQPQQGSHPEGTDVSALEHILQGSKTIPVEKGIFLNETWRMHPSICAFISELFYESRLNSRDDLSNQLLDGNTKIQGAGLWFIPVEHEGNQSSSVEEVERINKLVLELTKGDVFWTDKYNVRKLVTVKDILIIAPYNAQVMNLIANLPAGCQVGTNDKFQGQEAPIVIFSLTTSSPEEAPRGMEFLYSQNRFNVGVSRAKSACIIVGSAKLFEPECKSPSQMKLANAFCRYNELSIKLN